MSSTRRQILRAAVGAGLAWGAVSGLRAASGEKLPRVRPLTSGPRFHWFGYYDKLQFDPSGRYVLGMEVSFEHRLPEPADAVRIGMVDTHDRDRWIDLGESYAWCWQQGCMLQWLPGSDRGCFSTTVSARALSAEFWTCRAGNHVHCRHPFMP